MDLLEGLEVLEDVRRFAAPVSEPEFDDNPTILAKDDPVRVAGRFGIVRDHDHRLAHIIARSAEQAQHLLTARVVPSARSMPISRVRSVMDMANVL